MTEPRRRLPRRQSLVELEQRFGRLVVTSLDVPPLYCTDRAPSGRLAARCHCDCGSETVVMQYDLTSGGTRSCGCLKNAPRRPAGQGDDPVARLQIGANLRAERLAADLAETELASLAGLSPGYIRRLEQGHRMSPSLDALQKLAGALRVPISALLTEEELASDAEREKNDEVRARLNEALGKALSPGTAPRGVILYRYYDEQDILLYIGIAFNLTDRQQGHIAGSPWMEFAVRSTIARFPSRKDALAAEKASIRAERPLFNVQHNNSLKGRLRLAEYLIEHDRDDLIPLIKWPSAVLQIRNAFGESGATEPPAA